MKHFTGFFLTVFSLFSLNSTIAQEPGRSDTLDVLNYGIHLNINDFTNKTIQGYTTIKTTFKETNVNRVNFDLLALSVDSIFIGNAKHTNFTYNDTLISIQLATAVTPSDTLDFSIFYHGAPVTDPSTWGGFYYTATTAYNLGCGFQSVPHNFGRVWFPCIDEFRDKAYYDFYITTLNNHMAVCNGTLMDSVTNPNATKTWHWKLGEVIPTYLASVAVGDYRKVTIPLVHNTDTLQANLYVYPSDTTKALNSFVNLNQIFNAYVDHWGPYRWERVGYVGVAFNGGAMEHATNITYPESLIDGGLSAESLYGHELAHSWFGNLITCASAEDMWINEGWARYSEALYMGVLHPNADPMLDGYKVQIRDLQYKTFRKAFSDDGGNFPLYPVPQNVTYGTTTYDKGALIVHTLRNYLGDDRFFNSVRQVLQEYSYKTINSAQFCERLSHYSGIDLHDFFNAWIYQPGYLHFSIDSLVASPAQNGEYTYYIHQKHSLGNNLGNSNRVEVTFFNQNWASVTDTIHFSGETGSKTVTLPFIPVLTAIDYHERMADAIVDYNLKIKTTGNNSCTNAYASINVVSLEDSAFIRVEHHWAAPDTLKSASPAISRLSPNRYWKIDGIAPIDFHAKVNFNFYNATDMDASLLNGAPSDSLIMLYRRNAAEDWRLIPFTKAGTNSGIIKVDTLLFGEYTLAIGDKNQVGMTEVIQDEVSFDINPNPSKEFIQINTNSPSISYYQLINASGKIVLVISCTSTSITVNTSQLANGVYIVQAQNKLGKTIHSKKMVIANN